MIVGANGMALPASGWQPWWLMAVRGWHLAMLGGLVSVACDDPARVEPGSFAKDVATSRVSSAPSVSVSVATSASSVTPLAPPVTPPPDAQLPLSPMPDDAPARRHAAMSVPQCKATVAARGLPVVDASADGVRQPMRLTGPLSGVDVTLPTAPSPLGVMDCRLVVALDDVAGWLAAHGVRVIRADNTHRPNAMMKSGEPSQHALGMAIDIMAFERRDGRVVPVLGTWPPRLGQTPCGPGSPAVASDDERWLRGVVCDLARRHAFHHMLTPNTDAAHRDHLHFDLDPTSTSLFLR